MIKVNLLPVKKKKKAKPLPTFLISMIGVTIAFIAILLYVFFYYNSRVDERKAQIRANEGKIADLKEKIKAVEDFEKRNAVYQQRKDIIETLGKNKTVPVKILDEVSTQLPLGVWVTNMGFTGTDVNLSCVAFSNTDVVNYVNNLKNSPLFSDVYLQESVQAKIANNPVYNFRITFKVKK